MLSQRWCWLYREEAKGRDEDRTTTCWVQEGDDGAALHLSWQSHCFTALPAAGNRASPQQPARHQQPVLLFALGVRTALEGGGLL